MLFSTYRPSYPAFSAFLFPFPDGPISEQYFPSKYALKSLFSGTFPPHFCPMGSAVPLPQGSISPRLPYLFSCFQTANTLSRIEAEGKKQRPVIFPASHFHTGTDAFPPRPFPQVSPFFAVFRMKKITFLLFRRHAHKKSGCSQTAAGLFRISIYGFQKRTTPRFPAPNGFRSPARYTSCALPSPGTPPEPAAPPVPHPLRSRHDR